MKKNKYKELSLFSRNKKFELKRKLTYLADNAKSRLNSNQKLREFIIIKKREIALYKEKFIKYSNFKISIDNIHELKNEFIKALKRDNSNLLIENNQLKKTIIARNSKNEEILSKSNDKIYNNFETLNSIKEKNFLYKNALISKEYNIKCLIGIITNIKKHINDEIIDVAVFDESDLEDFMIKSEFKKILEFYSNLTEQNLVQFNKLKNKSKKLSNKIPELKLLKKNIKKYVKTLNNIISYFDFTSVPQNSNIIIEGEENIFEPNNINEDNNIYNSNILNLLEESESFITENDISNVLDTKDVDVIRNIFIEEKSRLIIKSKIPKLDLALINFNKQKLTYDYQEKSLSRNDNNEHDILSLRIIKLKEEIKTLTDKNDNLKEKIKKYENKINKYRNIIININNQNQNTFRIKSVKKRKFLFNSTNAFSNVSRNAKSVSYRVDLIHSRNQLKLDLDK